MGRVHFIENEFYSLLCHQTDGLGKSEKNLYRAAFVLGGRKTSEKVIKAFCDYLEYKEIHRVNPTFHTEQRLNESMKKLTKIVDEILTVKNDYFRKIL